MIRAIRCADEEGASIALPRPEPEPRHDSAEVRFPASAEQGNAVRAAPALRGGRRCTGPMQYAACWRDADSRIGTAAGHASIAVDNEAVAPGLDRRPQQAEQWARGDVSGAARPGAR
jgi:hypothetical protein